MTTPTVLRLAVCLYPHAAALDFMGPVELLTSISSKNLSWLGAYVKGIPGSLKYAIDATYLAHTLEPLEATVGPLMLPSRAYDDVPADEQFDILLIPGGAGDVGSFDNSLTNFIKRQAPGAKYILTVCTGSWVLASTGLLNGKRATTNKSSFKQIKEATKDQGISWVAKARWVVNDDKKIWTSSGVTAGMDMASAFLESLIGKEITEQLRGIMELSAKDEGDDEFAAYYGLE